MLTGWLGIQGLWSRAPPKPKPRARGAEINRVIRIKKYIFINRWREKNIKYVKKKWGV
jgi:hypothetical protein